MSNQRIGVVGVGPVGAQLTYRYASLGYTLNVFDHDRARATAVARLGATPVEVPADVARDTAMVVLSLPDERAVDDAVFDCGGVTETLPNGGLVVNLSSTSVAYGRQATASCRRMGLQWLEAALVGSPVGVGRWAACLAAGALDGDFDRVAQPWLLRMAGQVTRLDGSDDDVRCIGGMDAVARTRMAMACAGPAVPPEGTMSG
jgi:3-hydroxyisobutyrate dehydrogenase-like beta-hydroxyacid dehydrogenase